ncbi:hypothetical protein CHUAL_005813 [Chamberlinius hualienensis]
MNDVGGGGASGVWVGETTQNAVITPYKYLRKFLDIHFKILKLMQIDLRLLKAVQMLFVMVASVLVS